MRQMLFTKQLLIDGFDFKVFLDHEYSISSPKALELLALVNSSYKLKLYRECRALKYSGREILVAKGWSFWKLKIYRRINTIFQKLKVTLLN